MSLHFETEIIMIPKKNIANETNQIIFHLLLFIALFINYEHKCVLIGIINVWIVPVFSKIWNTSKNVRKTIFHIDTKRWKNMYFSFLYNSNYHKIAKRVHSIHTIMKERFFLFQTYFQVNLSMLKIMNWWQIWVCWEKSNQ